MPILINEQNLALAAKTVAVPTYDRANLSPGILHFGVGNFHRAHMAVYMDRLFAQGIGPDWAIVGAGVRSGSVVTREKLKKQNWLTTVVELDPEALSARVVGSMIDFVPVDTQANLAALVDPRIRIVSLVLTEGGYFIDSATGQLATDDLAVQADAKNPEAPVTVFGLIVRAIALRRAAGTAAFAVISGDNLPGNGHLTKQTVVGLARLSDPELADWIERNVAFPNCMVDCITPMTSDRERKIIEDQFGIVDLAPVVCEPFRQWVIEDNFPNGRPPLEHVGVEFVNDVAGYELMKLRILNASHASLCYPAALLGHHFVHDAMADQDIVGFLRAMQSRDAIPTLKPLSGVDYTEYLEKVLSRFANPMIGDTIPRLTRDGSERQPKFILPTLQDALVDGGSIGGIALELALWCRYCQGHDETGHSINVEDPRAADLKRRAEHSGANPQDFIGNHEVFSRLGENERFAAAFSHWVDQLQSEGVRATLRAYAEG
ncbi:mannitol dehydrogenase family protein [Tropicimonas marinistellae]|uniref:mannitol dehydrogenase family protein n=1 Tax=Tropicimonas marinistellae TaxID=1739787 RepID=UPI000835133B|nr:mannitol dehydrogenase family protein [Tropicimonas marinistellae]